MPTNVSFHDIMEDSIKALLVVLARDAFGKRVAKKVQKRLAKRKLTPDELAKASALLSRRW